MQRVFDELFFPERRWFPSIPEFFQNWSLVDRDGRDGIFEPTRSAVFCRGFRDFHAKNMPFDFRTFGVEHSVSLYQIKLLQQTESSP